MTYVQTANCQGMGTKCLGGGGEEEEVGVWGTLAWTSHSFKSSSSVLCCFVLQRLGSGALWAS